MTEHHVLPVASTPSSITVATLDHVCHLVTYSDEAARPEPVEFDR
jgi:hypothetical protein